MLKSIFIEIINPSTKNLIVGPIHRHPCMELSEFNNDFFTSMRKATLWKKKPDTVLMSDFNVDLLKYEDDANTVVFLDKSIQLF